MSVSVCAIYIKFCIFYANENVKKLSLFITDRNVRKAKKHSTQAYNEAVSAVRKWGRRIHPHTSYVFTDHNI